MSTPTESETSEAKPLPSPLRCFLGSIVAGGIATAMYFLTHSIAFFFATRPTHFSNQITYNIAVAVRTLVVGLSTLGTGVFALAALGLLGLGIQIVLQQATKRSAP